MKRISTRRAAQLRSEDELRAKLLAEHGGFCQECGKLPDWRGLSLHHLTFKSHGGQSTAENCRLICGRCHSKFHGVIEHES